MRATQVRVLSAELRAIRVTEHRVLLARQMSRLGDAESAVQAELEDWASQDKVGRLWSADASLWTGADEDRWLGWLHVVDGWRNRLEQLEQIAKDVQRGGFRHALVMGMGGSSLCPDVLSRTFGRIREFPELLVLDSTVPAQIRSFEDRIDLARTLFVVPSKSGSTIETKMLMQYFFDKLEGVLGSGNASAHFFAITDPDTELERHARAQGFRSIAHGIPSIGGRFSALSNFGLIPASIAGLDLSQLLQRTELMVRACGPGVPVQENPGVLLGIILGTLAQRGRDKVTLILSPVVAALGGWLEQLIAESTGKARKGLVPVEGECVAPAALYGSDRLFVYVRVANSVSAEQDAAVETLEKAGQPVLRVDLETPMDLGGEFFRWEIATAVAGAILGVDPFDQPDVDAAKLAARKLMLAYEETGVLPEPSPVLEDAGLQLFTESVDVASGSKLEQILAAHLARLGEGDYFALNAYVEMNDENQAELQALRHAVRDAKRVATTLGYGPRFLHSTGQLHKGGPNSGVFLQITADDREDLAIPGQRFSFGVLKNAQAQGDFEVLAERGRRLLRVHLGPDVHAGLVRLREAVSQALTLPQ